MDLILQYSKYPASIRSYSAAKSVITIYSLKADSDGTVFFFFFSNGGISLKQSLYIIGKYDRHPI
ncbi:hypothetical protein BO224_08680 [Erysipelotrichaceae bacterium NYU-BL-E8]|uniref:Uncharacterized protein n=1 Tax=Ileibacterium valens TaxID=1862668 RepID=A0A1U7NI75_9FIRM|nr:hypothetical protein BO224_08680 [Erysipelotrichaceae bacterium NYU-BL-E8]OLU39158.1 hypothetical protein BM735_07935 [Erysipelotrichaceae bacterium NYU-BL-F16]OLU41914.1 hypothetical protein BO222_02520 [Ileibacterium valens]